MGFVEDQSEELSGIFSVAANANISQKWLKILRYECLVKLTLNLIL